MSGYPSRTPLRERLASRAQIVGDCHLWTGCTTDRGYGMLSVGNKRRYVHRLAYEEYVGPIPDGLEIDHLCHTRDDSCAAGVKCQHRRCLNPTHLELVTSAENTRRGEPARRTRCPNGHPYDEANTWRPSTGGGRVCRRCHAARSITRKKAERATRGPLSPKTHCKHGHPFDEANTHVTSSGSRRCRVCKRIWMRNARKEA